MSTIAEIEEKLEAMTPEEFINHVFNTLHELSMILAEFQRQLRSKPIFGGVFGHGGAVLSSWWLVRERLDSVSYFVRDSTTLMVLGWGASKADALDAARTLFAKVPNARIAMECAKHQQAFLALEETKRQEQEKKHAEERATWKQAATAKVRSIPRRRKQIFDESGGKCHYCSTALTLDGKWHIEHKMPKALGGGNEPGNLVASCVRCNHRKNDKTDIEFKAQLAKESA